nr:unnamed protein product [Spirometra erinaceieuropaei]
MAALNETQFSKRGQLEEVGAGYTFFWGGRSKAERRDRGQDDIVGRLTSMPQGINDRRMTLPLPPRGSKFAIISAYALTRQRPSFTRT